ncbi:type IV pili twitching motility protein PilT [Candidatus Daviesbacteria bacterium RIFOXYD1_FULL_41_10]|uniref:Type IV pili twitching motility protein PilT n=1 Tax=Candidatus Daviesbacteria bacterium RIFOXYD1_FULL_41_10 TaxID=1797801 RepID=A0A1F5N252_9BACT|nr:MAG: type IV pili twitching motility protein PilT [Candidatus Daviesbacteria bacterium RIFOXYD1_FULL_41_10]
MNIQQLLEITIERKASDLHLVVGYPPMVRLFGDLVPVTGADIISDSEIASLILSLLSPLQKQVFDSTFELDFAISFQSRARFRVNLFREKGHLSASLRLIPAVIPLWEELGLPPAVGKFSELRQGLILVTGPTGHGKSTTLASLINKINKERSSNIITIEDPIEYIYPKAKSIITQREMYLDTKTWSNALKAVLREDPDVVLVGEMRDFETIAATLTIAETGHLVFATLHTNSAAQSIDRIIDVFPEHQQPQIRLQLAAVLEAVVSQRLIPTVIPGRALAVELLLGNPALSSIIRDGKTHLIDNLIQTSAEMGMRTMEKSLVDLIVSNRVSFETAQNFSLRPDLLAKLVGGI